MIFRSEGEKRISGENTARVECAVSAEPTLDELSQRLVELRRHLDQVLADLDRVTSGARTGDLKADESSLRCHGCSRIGSTRQAGWTLRLCGDDELHPFCPDCDQQNATGTYVRPIRRNGVVTAARLPL